MLRRLFAFVVLVALILGGLYYWRLRGGGALPRFPSSGSGAVEALKDAKTTLAVKTAMGLVRSLKPYAVEATSENGVVTLRGALPREELKALAERTVAAVPDVRQVVNQLRVDAAVEKAGGASERTLGESFDDEALAVQVRLAFSLNRELEGADVTVRAYRRRVTLAGEVARAAQKRLAVAVAQETPNVESVVDEIRVRGEEQPSPAVRRAAVERALKGNPNLAPYHLTVRGEGQRIVLAGRVRTGAEKDLAGLLAREAAGQPVENAIRVSMVP